MATYLFNEGSFDSLDVGVVDCTVHVLAFGDDSRLFLERAPVRAGATTEALARSQTELQSRRSRHVVLSEGRWSGAGSDVFQVASYFRDGPQVHYHLRRHFIHKGSAFTVSMTAPIAARARVDARMDRVFDTLRLRGD